MAVTLAEAAVLSENQLSRAIHEMFVQESPILDRLPLMPIEGNAYAYDQEQTLPGVAFRGVNEGYTESTGTFNQRLAGTDFVCECGRDDCTAELSTEAIASRCARVVLHVVVRKETLGGESDTPAHLDGYGPISAEHVRELAARPDAVRREVDLGELVDHQAQRGNAYRPTAAVDAAVRGLFGTCSWPGCERAAWKSDLDHVCEFNHTDPSAGGPTCVCNLNPKCRFHHGLKTFVGGWVDDQVVDANGVIWTEVTTPEGFTVRQRALNMRLLPELGHLTCRHPAPTRPGSGHAGVAPERPRTRVEAKHQYRMRRRAANRRAREVVEAVVPTGASVTECGTAWGTEWGEPQF